MQAVLHVMGEEIRIECADSEVRRLEDLATALEARLAAFTGDHSAVRRLAIVSLSLLDEVQAKCAALARAHGEIEHLTDVLAEAQIETEHDEALSDDAGRIASFTQGAA